jgi:hypothetical protein
LILGEGDENERARVQMLAPLLQQNYSCMTNIAKTSYFNVPLSLWAMRSRARIII